MFSLMEQFRGLHSGRKIRNVTNEDTRLSDLCIPGGAVHGRILGWAEVAAATPFPLKFCIIFTEFCLRKIKSI